MQIIDWPSKALAGGLSLVCLALSACGGGEAKPNSDMAKLTDKNWQLLALKKVYEFDDSPSAEVAFHFNADKSLEVSTDCGTYEFDLEYPGNEQIQILSPGALQASSDCAHPEQEQAMLDSIAKLSSFSSNDAQLALTSAGPYYQLQLETAASACSERDYDALAYQPMTLVFSDKDFGYWLTEQQNSRPDLDVIEVHFCSGEASIKASAETLKRLECAPQVQALEQAPMNAQGLSAGKVLADKGC